MIYTPATTTLVQSSRIILSRTLFYTLVLWRVMHSFASCFIVASQWIYSGIGNGWAANQLPWCLEFDKPLGMPIGLAQLLSSSKDVREYGHASAASIHAEICMLD